MFTYDKAIRLTNSRITFDSRWRSEICCVSHAHSDHMRRHDLIYATAPTLEFMKARLGKLHATTVEFGKPVPIDEYEISFHPAGHILGSAQILAQRDDQCLLYTGDFKLEPSPAVEPIQIPECDILIMECTFGHPRFEFPPRPELAERLCEWAATALHQEQVPVVFAYTLGKSQEAMKIFADNGFSLCVHGTILRLTRIYEDFGYSFGELTELRRTTPLPGKVVVAPFSARASKVIAKIPHQRTMILSGWAMETGFKYRMGVDEALPLSDHADFPDLVEFVRQARPQRVFTTHGPASFATYLRQLGYDAQPLQPAPQGELF